MTISNKERMEIEKEEQKHDEFLAKYQQNCEEDGMKLCIACDEFLEDDQFNNESNICDDCCDEIDEDSGINDDHDPNNEFNQGQEFMLHKLKLALEPCKTPEDVVTELTSFIKKENFNLKNVFND